MSDRHNPIADFVARVEALEATSAKHEARLDDHDTRIAALEDGGDVDPVPPDPGDLTPSPDGTHTDQPGVVLVSAALNSFELYANAPQGGMGILYNGSSDPQTHHVGQLYAEGGLVYQQETQRGDWYVSQDNGDWSPTRDPTAPDPIPPDPGEPPAEGYGAKLISLYTRSPGGETWNFGNGADKDKLLDQGISIYESEAGVTVNSYLMFPMWGSMLDWGKWNLNGMLSAMKNNSAKAGSYVPVVGLKPFWNGVPPQYYEWNSKQGLLDCANGMYDQVWRECIDACANNGFTTTVWRLGYEDNFGFMTSFAGYSAENQQDAWKAAFKRQADVLHDQAKKRGIVALVAFNPSLGRGGCSVEAIIPDLSCFDIFACDAYNSYYGDASNWANDPNERKRFWSQDYYGWNQHLANAKACNKGVAIFEHGAGVRPDGHSLKDSVTFWDWSAGVIKDTRAQNVKYYGSGIWDIPASDINCATSNGAQPPCMGALNKYYKDGSLIGDPLWEPASMDTRAAGQIPEAKTQDQQFVFKNAPKDADPLDPTTFNGRNERLVREWHKEFAEFLRTRRRRPGMRA